MPQPKKVKTSKDKAVERARRAKTSKDIKERLDHETYLNSQFDEDGNLLNIIFVRCVMNIILFFI